jgi:hypothetical protein
MREATDTRDMRPHFEDIQAHYDLSDDFFGLFQDPTRKYSCACGYRSWRRLRGMVHITTAQICRNVITRGGVVQGDIRKVIDSHARGN